MLYYFPVMDRGAGNTGREEVEKDFDPFEPEADNAAVGSAVSGDFSPEKCSSKVQSYGSPFPENITDRRRER